MGKKNIEVNVKVFTVGLILIILLVGTLGIVSALTTYEQETANKITNLFAKFSYLNEKGFYIFSSWGQENGCSVNPDFEDWIRGKADKPNYLLTSVNCMGVVGTNKCAIDIWYDNTIYLNGAIGPPNNVNWNNWLKEVTTGSFSSTAYPYYYIQVYACPDTPPVVPTHETKVYVCQQGSWSNKGYYEKSQSCSWDTSGTNKCWCSDESDNFYVDQSGNVHCRSSPQSSWCPELPTNTYCGDGTIQIPNSNGQNEQCDDGNTNSNDGCSSTCQVESPGGGSGTLGDIRLNGKVNFAFFDFSNIYSGDATKTETFKVPLKNFGSKTETINVEVGFYSPSYATKVADLYSAFPLFSSIPTPNCNPAEDFVKTKQVTLQPGETETIEIPVAPYSTLVTYGVGTHNFKTEPPVWFVGLYKKCLGGYINDAGTTGRGIMFDYGQYEMKCPFTLFSPSDIMCGGEKAGECYFGNDINEFKIDTKCEITSTVDVVNGTTPLAKLNKTTLIGAKKIAIDKETIAISTSADLLASSCLSSSECILPSGDQEKFSSSCTSIAKLRDEGTLTQADTTNFFDNAKTIGTGTAIGSAAGITACLIAGSVGVLASGPAFPITAPLILGCGAAGGLLGGAGTSIYLDATQNDNLLKELNAENANAVGICVKEPKSALEDYTGWAAFFKITGDKGVDGLLIILGIIILFGVIFKK